MSLPRTLGELQLYYLLQRANLSVYYQTFVQQGGDDVRQLCEAGEEEFLEIMALVGMATKPLHVRRMQKALREWGANPAAFSSLPQFRLAGASPQNSKRKSVSSSENAFPGSKRLRTLTSAPADCYSPNSGKSPAEGVRANQVIGRQLVTTTFPNSGSVEDVDLSRLNDKLATPLKMKDSDPAMGEDERGCGPSNTGRGDSTQLVHHQVATPLCKEDSSQLQRKADLFSLARPVAQEFAYRKTWLSVEEIDDPSVKSITCENQLRAVFQRTIVGECQEEFIKHQDVDSIGYRHNTKGNNGPLSRKPFASQPQAAECHSSAGSSADVAKIASPQDTGNHHDLRSKHRYTGGFEWLSWYQVTSEADRSHVGRRLPRLEQKVRRRIDQPPRTRRMD